MNQQFEFRVWDKPNKMFLSEFQTDHGEWVWGRGKHLAGMSSWKWILDHPEDFAICMYVGVKDTEGNKIFTNDIVSGWTYPLGTLYKERYSNTGVIQFVEGGFSLNCNGVYLSLWTHAEELVVDGNIFENPVLGEKILAPK